MTWRRYCDVSWIKAKAWRPASVAAISHISPTSHRLRPGSVFVHCHSLSTTVRSSPSTMAQQITNRVMVVKPACFNFNPETAPSNKFQSKIEGMTDAQVQEKALLEFDMLVSKLREVKIQVNISDDVNKVSPEAVFPNNWISFHSETSGSPKIAVYPMLSQKRRQEKSQGVINHWVKTLNADVIDYSHFETQDKFLEGTGSMVLDRSNRIVYACTSPRTDVDVLDQFCYDFGYSSIVFRSIISMGEEGHVQEVYHTNVMMSVGDTFAIVCLESIPNKGERDKVVHSLEKTGKDVIPITTEQVDDFAGNVLQLAGEDGKKHLIMSTRAYNVFTGQQRAVIKKHCDSIVSVPLDVIERAGGGGARCMIAEVFPPL